MPHRPAGAQHLVSEPSVSPPPPKAFALSEPLPRGVQGWIWVMSDIRTQGCLVAAKELLEWNGSGQQIWSVGQAAATWRRPQQQLFQTVAFGEWRPVPSIAR